MNPQSDWQQLLRIALLGTRQSGEAAPATGGLPVPDSRENQLLQAAGTLALIRKAGFKPAADAPAVPAAAPTEILPTLGSVGLQCLQQLLDGQHAPLFAEYLAQLAQHGRRVPHRLLPSLLDYITPRPELQLHAPDVLGERGPWLASLNPAWAPVFAMPDEEALWETGTHKQRQRYLENLRLQNPQQARELLSAALPQEAAKQQAALLTALTVNLGPEDAALLEQYLNSKGKEVRQVVAPMLARISGSALAERLWLRASKMVQVKRSLLHGRQLHIELPEAWAAEWQADGVEQKDARFTGEKAAWLGQMLALIPPARWTEQFKLPPSRLLELVIESDWAPLLLPAWSAAAQLHHDRAWALALLNVSLAQEQNVSFSWNLLGVPPRAAVAELLLTHLQSLNSLTYPASRPAEALAYLPGPWPRRLNERAVELVQNTIVAAAQSPTGYQVLQGLDRLLNHLGHAAEPASFDSVSEQLQALLEYFPDYQRLVHRTLDTLYFRRQMAASLLEPPGPDS
ncbi:DUF5691 domain-containing protein [Hymenobacter koreensis]|uniref:Uncharacterized protein n=1 Tax=Hymenobacter koreensis TaxID=1084523 RepID=A0ABP8J6Q9_9BACT